MRNALTRAAAAALALVLALALSFAGPLQPAANAVRLEAPPQPNASEGPLFVFSGSGDAIEDPEQVFARAEPIYGSGGVDHLMTPITGTPAATAGSTQSYTFIASHATLRAGGVDSWEAWAPGALPVGGIVAPQLTASAQNQSNGAGLSGVFADVGGTYYLGVAFTRNGGVTVDSAVYRTMRILPGNRFTLDPVAVASFQSEQGIAPSTLGSVDGAPIGAAPLDEPVAAERFELVMPAVSTVPLGSVRRGGTDASPVALGGFAVIDTRASRLGWTLSLSASDFASGEHTIDAVALGVDPRFSGEPPAGVTLGQGKPAGSGAFGPIASGQPDHSTPAEGAAFDLGLTFVPPPDSAPATYTSTLTLTLLSN